VGKAAVIGGQADVERSATSDEIAAIFMYGLYSRTHKTAIEMMVRIAERPRQSPPAVKAPSWDERVKVRWTLPDCSTNSLPSVEHRHPVPEPVP